MHHAPYPIVDKSHPLIKQSSQRDSIFLTLNDLRKIFAEFSSEPNDIHVESMVNVVRIQAS